MKSDKISIELLELLGYEVKKIPTSDAEKKKEADFLVTYQGVTALIEAKLKEDSAETRVSKEKKLSNGDVFCAEGSAGFDDKISGISNTAKKQLRSSSDKKHDFKIISFCAVESNVGQKYQSFRDTIYGSTSIFDGVTKEVKTCYFYRNSSFYRHQLFDAAIISTLRGDQFKATLCLNPYSPKYEDLKKSVFMTPFNEAVEDPVELEKQGLAFIPNDDIDRKLNPLEEINYGCNHIIQHLCEKYNKTILVPCDFKMPEFSMLCNIE